MTYAKTEKTKRIAASELMKLPRSRRRDYLSKAVELAERDYRSQSDLTGFEAFGEADLLDEPK